MKERDTMSSEEWNRRYELAADAPVSIPSRPAQVLLDCAHLLPMNGVALDVACGLGANALFLAARGLRVDAWDYSQQAIDRLRATAESQGLDALSAELRDVVKEPPAPESYDVVVVSRFLERKLFPALRAALRRNGLLYYQTFIKDKDPQTGPANPLYLLDTNELLTLAKGFTVRVYREEGRVGNLSEGLRNEALLVAQKL
jgi:SAM-dependent methyltransferase